MTRRERHTHRHTDTHTHTHFALLYSSPLSFACRCLFCERREERENHFRLQEQDALQNPFALRLLALPAPSALTCGCIRGVGKATVTPLSLWRLSCRKEEKERKSKKLKMCHCIAACECGHFPLLLRLRLPMSREPCVSRRGALAVMPPGRKCRGGRAAGNKRRPSLTSTPCACFSTCLPLVTPTGFNNNCTLMDKTRECNAGACPVPPKGYVGMEGPPRPGTRDVRC